VRPLSAIVLRTIVYHELETIARRSARSRGGCTARAALGRTHEAIRDTDWMGAEGRAAALGVPVRVWKATLDDVLADIKANRESAKQAVIGNLYRRELDEADLDTKCDLLRQDAWFGEPLDNHIVLDTQCYRGPEGCARRHVARCHRLDPKASASDTAQREC
jgi:hypothetical protein